jgi:hypothetical protein
MFEQSRSAWMTQSPTLGRHGVDGVGTEVAPGRILTAGDESEPETSRRKSHHDAAHGVTLDPSNGAT